MIITADQLTKVASSITGQRAIDIANALQTICPQYGINTYDIFHEFIARVLEESGELKNLSENLNYKVDALTRLFPNRITSAQANMYGRKEGQVANEKAIANIIYGGNWGLRNLGNTQPNDGWDMRGGGALQLTGRGNYTSFTVYYNKKYNTQISIVDMANNIRTDINYAIHSACWVFAIAKKLIDLAISDNLTEIVKRINGGTFGLPETQAYYQKAIKVFV